MEVIGFPKYLIYPDGRVWSRHKGGRWLKYGCDKDGYLQVNLSEGGKTTTRKIHRLVAIHWIPNPENKPTVDHINRIRDDNRIENLRWATRVEQEANKSDYVRRNNNYKRIYKTNTGHRNVAVHWAGFQYTKKSKGKVIAYYFSTDKKMCLCYKFITQLKIRAGLL